MPVTESVKNALRQNIRRRAVNIARRIELKKTLKKFKALAIKDTKEAEKFLSEVFKRLDKAAKIKLIKKNTADRLKSRLSKKIAKRSS